MELTSTPQVLAVSVLGPNGARLYASFFGRLFKSGDAAALEDYVFRQAIDARGLGTGILAHQKLCSVYKRQGDVVILVSSSGAENELILATVLDALLESLLLLLHARIDSAVILQNLDLVMLCIDEMIDDGIILELDPELIAERASMRLDGDVPLEQSFQSALRSARTQFLKSLG